MINFILISCLAMLFQSCCPGSTLGTTFTGGFPTSVSETHTKTTIVTPPSYPVVNMPPPSINQAAPIIQQPVMMQAPVQAAPCAPMQAPMPSPCQPMQAQDACSYQVQVPQSEPARYTISIPPAPAPQYTIALPQGNPPQYAVMQQQAPTTTMQSIQLQPKSQDPCPPMGPQNPPPLNRPYTPTN